MRLYIDSVVLLQFRPLDEIDWRALTDNKPEEIELVVIPTVLREIEEKKVGNNRRLSKRADRIVQQLERLISSENLQGSIGSGVVLRIHTEEPHVDLREVGLNTSVADDWLLATILEDTTAGRSLVTDDIGLIFKARAKNINVIRPPAHYRLPPEEDDEIRKLKEENRSLRQQAAKMPQLALTFSDGKQILRTEITCPADMQPVDLDQLIAKRRDKLLQEAKFAVHLSERRNPSGIGSSAININSLDEYLVRLRAFCVQKLEHDRIIRHSKEIRLALSNTGQAPASGIEISIHFPHQVTLGEDPDFIEDPSEPLPPKLVNVTSTWGQVTGILQNRYDVRPALQSIATAAIATGRHDRIWHYARDRHSISMSMDRLLQTNPQICNTSGSYFRLAWMLEPDLRPSIRLLRPILLM
jgi:PIN domain